MNSVRSLFALALAFGLGSSAGAQTAPAPTPPPEETVQLSPFEVIAETDTGYAAANSMGATRTNTPLIELPQNIQVFNAEFIADIAATDTWDAVSYASNVVGGDRREDTTAGLGTSVRGYNVSKRLDGLDFPFPQTTTDPAVYERVELVKGSSSVLFGSTSPGGIINYVTKKPSLKRATNLTLRGGSYENYKAVVDTTGPLWQKGGNSLAFRLIGIYEDSETVRQFEFRENRYGVATLEARLGGRTTLRLRAENFQQDRREAISIPYMWLPTPAVTNPPGGTPITAPGILLNLPDDFYRGEPTDYKNSENTRYDFVAEHRFGSGWVARTTLAHTDWNTRREETPLLAQTNQFGFFTRRSQQINRGEDVALADVSAIGDFNLGRTRHRLLAGYTYSKVERFENQVNFALTPNFNVLAPQYGVSTRGPANPSLDALADITNHALFAQDQVRLLDDKVHLTLGIRRDDYDPVNTNQRTGVVTNRKQDKVSPRYSALYRLREDLSVYLAYNETFQPASGVRGDGTLLEPPTTEIIEAGVKFSLLDNKLTGSFAVFSAELGNQNRPDPANPGGTLQTSFESRGAEIDFVYSPFAGWQILGGIGHLDTEISRNDGNAATVGNRLFSTPEWTASFWNKYEFRSGPLKGFSAGLGVNHHGSKFDSDNNLFLIPSYTVLNGLLRYGWDRYSVSLNAQNLLDEDYISQIESARFSVRGESRRYFVTFTARF